MYWQMFFNYYVLKNVDLCVFFIFLQPPNCILGNFVLL
jgi:hypothetical protein